MAKSWSYAEITQSAEESIRLSIQLAEKAEERGDTSSAHTFRCFARGSWHMWNGLVTGWIKNEDSQRLKALCEPSQDEGSQS